MKRWCSNIRGAISRDRTRRSAETSALLSLDRLHFRALGHRATTARVSAHDFTAALAYVAKLAVGGFMLALFEISTAKMRVFRVPEFLGAALMLGILGDAATLRLDGACRWTGFTSTSRISSPAASF